MFGRGSSDMKSGLVAMLFAARALKSASRRMTGRLGLLFVPDEETGGAGGSGGAGAGRRAGARRDRRMLLPEPTSGRIWNSEPGRLHGLKSPFAAGRRTSGCSYGVNAVEKALPILDRLFALKRELDARGSDSPGRRARRRRRQFQRRA